jgi:hypothetical protein
MAGLSVCAGDAGAGDARPVAQRPVMRLDGLGDFLSDRRAG